MTRKFVLAISVVSVVLISSDAMAQRGGRGQVAAIGRGGSMIELLMRQDIREEIELVDDQEQQLRELGDELRDSMRSAFAELQDLDGAERFAKIREILEKRQKEFEEKLGDVLLKHQVDRLKQIQVQSRMRRGGASSTLGSDSMKEALGLTDDQLNEIQEVAKEAEEELRKKIAEAQKEALNKILTVLSPEQRRKWEDLVGKSFDFDNRRAVARGRGEERGNRRRGRGGGGFGRENSEREVE